MFKIYPTKIWPKGSCSASKIFFLKYLMKLNFKIVKYFYCTPNYQPKVNSGHNTESTISGIRNEFGNTHGCPS